MNAIDLNYTVDLAKMDDSIQTLSRPLYYGDNNAHRINVTVLRNGQPEDLTDVTCGGYIVFEETQETYPLSEFGSKNGNVATITLPSDAYLTTGRVYIVVRLSKTNFTTTVLALYAYVSLGETDNAVVPATSKLNYDQIASIVNQASQAISDMQDAMEDISEITGAVKYTVQNLKPNEQVQARLNIGAEYASATEIPIEGVGYINCSRDAASVELTEGADPVPVISTFNDTSTNKPRYTLLTVTPGEKYTIRARSIGTSSMGMLLIAADGTIIDRQTSTSASSERFEILTIPNNAKWLYMLRNAGSGSGRTNMLWSGAYAPLLVEEVAESVSENAAAITQVVEGVGNSVKITAQTLTDAQQTQARHNINTPSEPGVVGGDQHLAITATMENAWLNNGAVVYHANYLMSQIIDINQYMLCILDSGYSAGALYYSSGVTNRASYSSTSGFKTGWLVLKPGERVSVVLRKNSDNTAIPLSDLKHMRIYDGYGKPSYTNSSPIGSLTSFAKITTVGTYFLSYNIDITNTNKSDLPTEYNSGDNAVLDIKEYFYSGNRFLIQRLYTLTTPIKQWVRYSTNAGSAWNAWTRVMDRQEVMSAINKSVLAGKKVSIYGDSISTFTGHNPSGNAVWYTGSNCGVSAVTDTWWKKTIDALGLTLLVNNSWSGRFACGYADTWTDRTTNAGYKQANIDVLGSNGTPDIIVVMLGINDFNNEAPLGTYDGTTTLPTDPNTFTGGYAMMLDRIMTTYPLAQIYCCTCVNGDHNSPYTFPEINGNGVALSTWNDAIRKLAGAFGAKVIDFSQCGMTHYNMSTYIGDYNQQTGDGVHPNAAGHSLMANEAIRVMDESVKTRY